jgi:hypothetical protein
LFTGGHTLGFWRPARSWLLPGVGEPALRVASSVVWIVAAAGFIASCLALLGVLVPADRWRPLTVVFAIVSTLGLALFFGTWPAFNTVGALGEHLG